MRVTRDLRRNDGCEGCLRKMMYSREKEFCAKWCFVEGKLLWEEGRGGIYSRMEVKR